MLGRIVDWLAARRAGAALGRAARHTCCCWPRVLAGQHRCWSALQTLLKHQTLAVNFPMRLRWNFHRLMLGQSMAFYQDEFAGRIATKVMQTALAVRDTWIIAGRHPGLRRHLLRHACWRWLGGFDALAAAALPRLAGAVRRARCATSCRAWAGSAQGAGRCALADDRPHHRRLHQHRHRQAVLARAARGRLRARRDAGVHGHRLRARCGWSAASRSSTTC